MHFKVLFCSGLILLVFATRVFEDSGSSNGNFVMIGTSNDEYNNKKLVDVEVNPRSHMYASQLHNRPSSDYSGGYGYPVNPPNQPTSLIPANIHLLEPFMLVTFLLFVLSLIERARGIPGTFKRSVNITSHDDYDRHHQQHFLKMINETGF